MFFEVFFLQIILVKQSLNLFSFVFYWLLNTLIEQIKNISLKKYSWRGLLLCELTWSSAPGCLASGNDHQASGGAAGGEEEEESTAHSERGDPQQGERGPRLNLVFQVLKAYFPQ